MGAEYPAPKHRFWRTQIEFLDGTVVDAADDEDAIARWRRLASWTDPTAEANPVDWMGRVLDRARVVYGCGLVGIQPNMPASRILDALAEEGVILLRRK